AERIRAHGGLGLAKAVGGYQGRELGFGVAGYAAGEMPLAPQLGAEVEFSVLGLTKGKDPRDVTIQPGDGANAIYGAVGLQARPFVTADPTDLRPLTGIWASANVGATTTGGLFRGVVDAHLGYDFFLSEGRYAVGPELWYAHVFQSDSEFRPEDANILVFGAHVMFDSAERIPPDRDRDGIIDRDDQCPDVPEDKDGFEDQDGCPDLDNDGDGIQDPQDHCPVEKEDKDGFEDEDGCRELDNDKDGIIDEVDQCPLDPEDIDDFEDQDGCPDKDNDQDGIVDKEDLCPYEPETKNGYADDDGCPDEDQVRVVGEKIVLDDRVHFEQNNAIIRPVSFPLLERLSKLVREHPEYVHIEVQGHTDQKGTAEFNQKLSRDRAESVVDFLGSHGVERGRLSAVGFGSEHLLVDQTNERALYLNRRVEFVITRDVRKGKSGAPGAKPSPGQTETVAPPAPPPAAPTEKTP
ncbi:MAG TPA: OmpA family protein, partial [Polyangiaceae bacterium]|nr:OmpA family protein [Polyangiaceae bacterium]